jgi:hypothetical protein
MVQRISLRPSFWIIAGVACAGVAIWQRHHIATVWDDPKIVNFLAAWIPFVLSILLAFVPDHEMSTAKRIIWRGGVIFAGFAWSVVLWHQQVVTEHAAQADQENIVASAVTKANVHSDQQIGNVRQDLTKTASKEDLSKTAGVLTNILAKSQADLTSNINKLKPTAPEIPKFEFSIYSAAARLGTPVLSDTVTQDKDGTYSVSVNFTNSSDVPAEVTDIWLQVCDACSFATEPSGMDKPSGIDEHARHMLIGTLNAGASFQKITLAIKTTLVPPTQFMVGFRYTCKSCGTHGVKDTQKVTFLALPMPPPS